MTEPNARWQRRLVLFVASASVALAVYCLPLIWNANAVDTTLRERLYDTIGSSMSLAMLAICLLIAWRGGDSIANLAMALAFCAASVNDTISVALHYHGVDHTLFGEVIGQVTYIVGAGLFLRASQLFPRPLTAAQAGARVLIVLLKPVALWPTVIALGFIANFFSGTPYASAARLAILALGAMYFYRSYRTGDAEMRRKVLWFLAMVVAAAAITIVSQTVRLALGTDPPETLRLVVGVSLTSLDTLAIVGCMSAAVFYAGAISPSLVIRKTVVYGATTALLLFVFATVEVFLHHQIVHFLHVTDTFASSLLGGAFGLTFHPVKHYFENLLKRYQGGHRAVH